MNECRPRNVLRGGNGRCRSKELCNLENRSLPKSGFGPRWASSLHSIGAISCYSTDRERALPTPNFRARRQSGKHRFEGRRYNNVSCTIQRHQGSLRGMVGSKQTPSGRAIRFVRFLYFPAQGLPAWKSSAHGVARVLGQTNIRRAIASSVRPESVA